MINVRRIDQPKILSQKARAWTQKLLAAQTEKDRSNAQKKYRHRNIKDDLVRMFRSKCAYCESKITHVDYGHIDHYRPKSKFPDLTFEWSNLLLACGICNGTKYKGELKPFAKRLKKALEDGEASYKKTTGKHIYLFDIRKKEYHLKTCDY